MRLIAAFTLALTACAPTTDTAVIQPRIDARVNPYQAAVPTTTTTEQPQFRAASVTTTPRRHHGNIADLIRAIWPDDSEEMAVRVAWCESRLNPAAQNPSGASGIFQLMLRYHAWRLDGPWYDPAANTRAALSLYRQSGWNPWRASAHCWR